MIEYKTGNLLSEDVEALVNSVNCVGIMGRGVALHFRQAWPENFKAYVAACQRGEVQPGRMFVFATGRLTNPRYIVNFPTKRHWRGKSRYEDITAGLAALVETIRQHDIRSIALPALGCGLGGLDWAQVRPLIEAAFANLPDVRVVVYEPAEEQALPANIRTGQVPAMTPGRAALISLIERYLAGGLDPMLSLLEVHKLMYFLQEAGEPLRLKFVKGPYGPYAENLRHVLRAIDGYFITGYGAGGDQPFKTLELLPGAATDAQKALDAQPETRARFDRVARLVEGFESPYGLELLATAHWVVTREHPASELRLIEAFYAWAPRKRYFTPEQIRLAVDTLHTQHWIDELPKLAAGPSEQHTADG